MFIEPEWRIYRLDRGVDIFKAIPFQSRHSVTVCFICALEIFLLTFVVIAKMLLMFVKARTSIAKAFSIAVFRGGHLERREDDDGRKDANT